MKIRISFILVTILASTAFCDYSIYSVFFSSINTGYIVGADWSTNSNLILKTTNGGISWTIKSSGDSSFLYSVCFIDESNGYAVGEDLTAGSGIIYKTTNGGDIWTSQSIDPGSTFVSVHFPTADTGYIAGTNFFQGSVIKKTTDGGLTWLNLTSGTNNWLWSVYFDDARNGYACGANGTIIKTTNGGTDWTALQSGTNLFLSSIWFTTLSTGYAVGENGMILKTSDSGANWHNKPSGTSSFLHSIYFTDSSNGFIAGNVGTILKTTNNGENWNIQSSGTFEDLRAVHFPDYSNGYIIGTQETFLKTSDVGNSWSSLLLKTMLVLSPNGAENWYNGSSHQIEWNAHSIENIKIELSMDNGSAWSTIVASHINNGEFFWTISVPDGSEESLVKISDASDSNAYDISDETFTIIPVGITVTSPDGGEVWENGSLQNITWTTENLNVSNLRIRLSTDVGISWITIEVAAPNNGSYSWIVNSSVASDECVIKIETLNHLFSDESDSVFTIEILPGVDDNNEREPLVNFALFQNFPNPFNPLTIIKFQIPSRAFVSLKIYDVLGNEVDALINRDMKAGSYEVEFDASGIPSGIYFCRLQTESFAETKKMVLLK